MTFKRYKAQDENDRSFNDGSKLDDIAYLASFSNLEVTDLVKFTDEGLHDENDNFFTDDSQWFEIVDVDKEGKAKSDQDFSMMIKIVPVDDYGKPLTKTQMRKINSKWADKYEKYGYAKCVEIQKYEDEPLSVIPKVLVVNTNDVPNWDYRGNDPSKMSYGRYITSAPYGEEELYDDKDQPTGKTDRWARGGDASVRKAAFERQKQADMRAKGRADRQKARDERFGELMKDADNPWTSNGILVKDLKKLYPNVDERDLKKIVDEAKDLGYSTNGMSEDELKKFCTEVGVEPDAVDAISSSSSSLFAKAMSNSTRNGYDY